jgi:nucleotide-binding universal stress UspA family protein
MTNDLDPALERLNVGPDDRKRILVGLDGSRLSRRALDYAFGIAARQSARLTAIHVWKPWIFHEGGVLLLEADPELATTLRDEVDELARRCCVDATYVEISDPGPASRVLARVAQDFHADALIVGASDHPLHRLIGSTGSHLIKRCACPVTVVP